MSVMKPGVSSRVPPIDDQQRRRRPPCRGSGAAASASLKRRQAPRPWWRSSSEPSRASASSRARVGTTPISLADLDDHVELDDRDDDEEDDRGRKPSASGRRGAQAAAAAAPPPARARPATRRCPSAIDFDVLHRVVVGEQAEADLAVVAHDRHRQRVVLRQEGDREDLLQLAPEHVERDLRARARW